VLIPAHNEKLVIDRTVSTLRGQLQAGDLLLVVADNCEDETANVARAAGATVVERTDAIRRSKGYALDFGIRELEKTPPDVVVIVDADCQVHEGALDRLIREAAAGHTVQAVYLLDEPAEAGNKERLSAFAFKFKNLVRPLGLNRLGFPCLLTGTGMAFPWPVLRDAGLASGNIVEDMQLGVDLAVAGHPPKLCPGALVSGELPSGGRVALGQRRRWEHGHLMTMLTQVPRLVRAAVARRQFRLLGLALELSVPPLALLFLLWGAVLAVSAGWWLLGGSAWPVVLLVLGVLAVGLAIFAAWFKFGRERLPFTALLSVPFYVLWKVPIYASFLFRRQGTFNKTPRGEPTGTPAGGAPSSPINPV
jgi:cellulose synthase/poly-beta-1,6-N-acetylglucosamine synthase-like glycosyltransferase